MDMNTVLSLSSDPAALASRESALRNGGMNVISVMSPMQARFEIEMGRCGIFLVCYRVSQSALDELTKLFRKRCPKGRIIFVSQRPGDDRVPADADIALPESAGPQKILEAMSKHRANALLF
jgi:predicted nucleotidyltransferase